MINAGKYNKRISIVEVIRTEDADGFETESISEVLKTFASVKTTRGYTLIKSGSDFESAYTNFTIRYPKTVNIKRDMLIFYNDRRYRIDYINNIDENDLELELQALEVTK